MAFFRFWDSRKGRVNQQIQQILRLMWCSRHERVAPLRRRGGMVRLSKVTGPGPGVGSCVVLRVIIGAGWRRWPVLPLLWPRAVKVRMRKGFSSGYFVCSHHRARSRPRRRPSRSLRRTGPIYPIRPNRQHMVTVRRRPRVQGPASPVSIERSAFGCAMGTIFRSATAFRARVSCATLISVARDAVPRPGCSQCRLRRRISGMRAIKAA